MRYGLPGINGDMFIAIEKFAKAPVSQWMKRCMAVFHYNISKEKGLGRFETKSMDFFFKSLKIRSFSSSFMLVFETNTNSTMHIFSVNFLVKVFDYESHEKKQFKEQFFQIPLKTKRNENDLIQTKRISQSIPLKSIRN